jgi:hypothetical protein
MGKSIEFYLNLVINNGLYTNRRNLEIHLYQLFNRIDFTDKSVLDIGGGSGLYSFYAATMGASKVVCLEPEGDGSTDNIIKKFHLMNSLLDYNETVSLETVLLQEFSPTNTKFDVILLLNTINHLDEPACIDLLNDKNAQNVYKDLFAKIYELANEDAILMVSDCSPRNFFCSIGVKNPFVPNIEWHKHQTPEAWIKMLANVGFIEPKIWWSSFNRIGKLGHRLMGNRLMAYYLMSHFCFVMTKP